MAQYDVTYNGEMVGVVELTQKGLYYEIFCRCKLLDGMFRLFDMCDNGNVVIGICAPVQGHMEIRRMVPVKTLGEGRHGFVLHSDTILSPERFVPLEGPLSSDDLYELNDARLCIRDGKQGLVFVKQKA